MNINKKGSVMVILAIIVLVLVAGVVVYFVFKNKPPIVGGDKDEHGCIGSAGYSWCAAKNKCLRIWEEYCGTSVDKEEAFNLIMQLRQQTNLPFDYGKDVTFKWMKECQPGESCQPFPDTSGLEFRLIPAPSVVYGETDYKKIIKFFEDNGYVEDMFNAADGPTGSLRGYIEKNHPMNHAMACHIIYKLTDARDFTIDCGVVYLFLF